MLTDSGAKLCFATTALAGELEAHAPPGTAIVEIGAPQDVALLAADPLDPVARDLGDDAWLFFTSGTTGRAKGARISHGNLLAMTAAYYADVSALSPRDSIIHVAALSHASGLFSLPFIGRGAGQVLPPSGHFDAAELLALIAAGERSTFFVPPTLLRRLCAAPQVASTPGRPDRHRDRRRRAGAPRGPARRRRRARAVPVERLRPGRDARARSRR